MEKRIALYGGTFDPVHAGHMTVARGLLELFALDEVLFIPAHVAPHKRSAHVSVPLHRYAMLALATQDEKSFRISTVELDAPERPYTVETLARFQETLGQTARLFFVMGADSWAEIKTWREWERVLSLTDHLVVTRPGYELSTAHITPTVRERVVDLRGAGREEAERALCEPGGTRIYLTDAAQVDAAATDIRRSLRNSEAGAKLNALDVPSPVAGYIEKYRLYREVHERESLDIENEQTH
ncbi:MAG: nicotinate-nucleotide adenylyltransferase [Acidobacteria bacterium]|nr:nicotinate-nucleotide adenylyltransferase [Acidobacteriota bacterium]